MNTLDLIAGADDTSRELASRESNGVCVLLLWHPTDDTVTVSIEDTRAGQCVEVAVQRDCALEAFYHPFAYAA